MLTSTTPAFQCQHTDKGCQATADLSQKLFIFIRREISNAKVEKQKMSVVK